MGTPEFACPALRDLESSQNSVVAVVTGPDALAGRGRKLRPTPVKELATQLGIPVLTPTSLKSSEFIRELERYEADVFVVVAFRILPRAVFSLPRLGSINLHGSLLPYYRGAAPIQRALMDGAVESGLTVFLLSERVDTGEIVLQKRVSIMSEDNFTTLSSRLAKQSGALLIEALGLLESGSAQALSQDDSLATSAPKITVADCLINWSCSAVTIVNQIRGLSETPGAFTHWRGKRLKALAARVCQPLSPLSAGEVALVGKRICIGAGEGSALELLILQPEGKKKMTAVEIINGQFLRVGEQLGEGADQT